MAGFLGVPIIIRGDAFGSLYLTHSDPARAFDESDEVAARALATAAAVAIQNASLFERVRASAKWMQASREITTVLLSGTESSVRPMWLIAERARELAKAEQAIVLVAADPDAPREEVTTLVVSTAVGVHADDVIGRQVPVEGSTTGAVFTSGRAVITDRFRHPIHSFTDVGERPAIVMPLRYEDGVIGVIAVARHESAAVRQRRARADRRLRPPRGGGADPRGSGRADSRAQHRGRPRAHRPRSARSRHPATVRDRHAPAGHHRPLALPEVVERLNRTLDDLQATIEDIRTTIFGLQSPVRGKGFRQRVQHLFAGLTEDLATETRLHLSGPLTVVDGSLAEHAEAVLTELISNAVRHSGAGLITVDVAIADELVIQVIDDGHGIPADNQRHSGLSNVERRAEQAGGHCEVSSTAGLGTSVTWRAPLTGY